MVARQGPGSLGGRRQPFPLRHWDQDVYLFQPVGENAEGPSAVTFRGNTVVIDYFNTTGLGTFHKTPPSRR